MTAATKLSTLSKGIRLSSIIGEKGLDTEGLLGLSKTAANSASSSCIFIQQQREAPLVLLVISACMYTLKQGYKPQHSTLLL